MIPQSSPATIKRTSKPFYRQYLACQLSNLNSIASIDITFEYKFPNLKNKLNPNWPNSPLIISDKDTFYYITFNQPYINVFDILPDPKKYNIILNEHTPLSIHINNRVVYLLLLGGKLVEFQLGTREFNYQTINQLQDVDCIYSIQTLVNFQNKPTLKIMYESGGLKYYEHNTSGSFFSNILSSLKSNNFRNLIPIPPNNLLGFVITFQNELKLINLHSRELMDCDPISLDPNINIHLLNLRFATKVVSIRTQGFVTFLMCLFEVNGSIFKLFKVKIRLNMNVDKLVNLDDFVGGSIGQRAEIKLMAVFNQEKQIQDITMNEEGVFICHKKHHNSPILRSSYREYSNILVSHPIEMIQSQVFKKLRQEHKISDQQVLKQRMLDPFRFTISFLNNNNLKTQQIYHKLMTMPVHQLKVLTNRLTTAKWPVAYKFIGIINFENIIFVVRNMSISLLIRNSYGLQQFQNYYYETEIRCFEDVVKGYEEENEGSLISRLSIGDNKQPNKKELQTPLQIISIDVVQEKLYRKGSACKKEASLYSKLFSILLQIINVGGFQSINYTNTQPFNYMVRNTVLSQIRHFLKVISTLLVRFYPHSRSDCTSNDKNVIINLLVITKLVLSPLKLYQSYFYDVHPSEFIYYDILSLLIIKESVHQSSFGFSSFDDKDYLKIIGLLLKTDLDYHKSQLSIDHLASFNSSSELMKLIVLEAEKNPQMKYYTKMLTKIKPPFTKHYLLKAYLISDELQAFASKILSLAVLHQFSCKFLHGLFQNNFVYRKGKAILQYLSTIFEQHMTSENLQKYVPLDFKSIIELMLEKCDKIQFVETTKDAFSYMDTMKPHSLLYEFIYKKKSLQTLINDVKTNKNLSNIGIFMLQLYKKQCWGFNILYGQELDPNLIRQFIKEMELTITLAVQSFKNNQNIGQTTNIKIQEKLLRGFQPFIFGRKPYSSFLDILAKCHSEYSQPRIIPYEKIPFYFIKHVLRGSKDLLQIEFKNLLKYFTQDAVVKALLENTSSNRLLISEKQAVAAMGYGALNYYKSLGQQGKVKEALEIIRREAKFRNFDKQQIV